MFFGIYLLYRTMFMCMFSLSVILFHCFFFFKQKTAYEMRISDWSSDVCSSDLVEVGIGVEPLDEGPALMAQIAFDLEVRVEAVAEPFAVLQVAAELAVQRRFRQIGDRSEEHTSELQSLMRISYAVFCLTKTTQINQ